MGLLVILSSLVASGSGTKILVPAYWGASTDSHGGCDESQFQALAAAGSRVAVIVNANDGPITPDNSYYNTYHACVQLLKDADNEVFGYVSTKEAHLEGETWVQTGFRDIKEVRQFISDWSDFWDLSGIFLDEVSSAWQAEDKPEWGDHVKFYQEIFEMVKEVSPTFRIMINAGGIPPPEFIEASDHVTADVTITLETKADKYDPQSVEGGYDSCLDTLWNQEKGSFPPGPWCPLVPVYDHVEWMKDGFDSGAWPDKAAGVILHDSEDHSWVPWDAVAQARQANFEYIFISERHGDSAYGHLPGYWDELVAAVSSDFPATTTSPPLPTSQPADRPECSDYRLLDDPTRRVEYTTDIWCCDSQDAAREEHCDDDDWKGPGWYRISGEAGTKIPSSAPGEWLCGTGAPGWVEGRQPARVGEKVDSRVCFRYESDHCQWETDIQITGCHGFLVYYLPNTPDCTLRYCGAD